MKKSVAKRASASAQKRKTKVAKAASKSKQSVSAVGQALRALGGLGGNVLGGMIGMPATGGAIGTGLGASLSKWLGAGDYTVRSNSIVTKFEAAGTIPAMHRDGQAIVIRHKEYVTDVLSNTTFGVTNSFAINPGLVTSFPWLAGIAQQYQEYTVRGMVYHYNSTSGDVVASSNTALGSVMICTVYRSTQPAFTSKVTMLNEYFCSDAKPSDCFAHPVECDPKENPYNVQYVRAGVVPSGEDPKSFDLGTVYVATEGMQAANVTLGELWVSYEIELRKPIATVSTGVNLPYAHYWASAGLTNSSPLGNNGKAYADSIGITIPTGSKIQFPRNLVGTYMLVLSYYPPTVVDFGTWISGGTLTNCTATLSAQGAAPTLTNGLKTVAATTSLNALAMIAVTIPDSTLQASILFGNLTTLTGATQLELFIMQTAYGAA